MSNQTAHFEGKLIGGTVEYLTMKQFHYIYGELEESELTGNPLDDICNVLSKEGYPIYYASFNPDDIINSAEDEGIDLHSVAKGLVIDDTFYISIL